MNEFLLDTDTISLFLRNEPKVMSKANDYLKFHKGFTFSIITRFEILRGLKVKNARRQITNFGLICLQSREINLTEKIINRASEIYADLYKSGQLISDADILIAATAMENNLAIVTNNENHFNRIANLQIVNWNK
ncbi:MAG TPA: type II toxin-antitoxin system VapC family toxin [Pyrinomonadaceae bacterium]|nr:type II toxin-antitoxin system VapC family toxin [Pyrinomonadaceae bacterium]